LLRRNGASVQGVGEFSKRTGEGFLAHHKALLLLHFRRYALDWFF
jgi:hypothetical protein